MMEQNTVDTSVNEVEQTTTTNATVKESAPVETVTESTTQKTQVVEKEKVFTQAQLDEIVVTRLGKEKARMLKKLGIDDESKLDEIVEKAKLFENVKTEAEMLKKEKELRSYQDKLNALGIDPDFSEYVLSKVDKGENLEEFEVNAKSFLEANPKFKKDTFKKVDSSLNLGSAEPYPDFEKMSVDQYLAWRAKNKL